MNIKTKRYTYNKINRMLLHILLDIKKEVIGLKERTISVLEKYNTAMSDLLD